MSDIFISDGAYISTASACITDVTPPTFAGISTLVVASRGQIRATWTAATDSTPPIRYEMYIQASTATGLFSTANIIAITDKLQFDTFTMPDGSFLVNGTTYYVGIRAIDGVSNRDSNTVSLSVISTGVFVSSENYEVTGSFSIDTSHNFRGTLWSLKNSILATGSNAVMGTASYQIYDKTGALVAGMSESGIIADANGQYKIAAVASTLADELAHYLVKITINVDGANRVGYVPLEKQELAYDILGSFFVNSSNNFDGVFWVTEDEKVVTTDLGTGSFQVYDNNGTPVAGMSGAGITADANGFFAITPVASLLNETSESYSVRIALTVDGVLRSTILPIAKKVPSYQVKAQFAINSSNQLLGTFWASVDGIRRTSGLGAANYTVYDAAGVAVAGLTQSGIAADGNGFFIITPVSAILLTDLTLYTVKVGIVVDGVERVDNKGFTLLGT